MSYIRKVIDDIKKYNEYIRYGANAELRSEVSGSYLGWMWWILDPLLFMLVYTFVVQFIFKTGGREFPVFVFIGLTIWNFFNTSIVNSVDIIKSYKSIISRVYVPKYILIMVKMRKNFIKMLISLSLVFVLMFFFHISYSPKIMFIFPMTIVLYVITFSVCVISAHIGVFVSDFSNILTVVLKFMFYMSGIIYSVQDRIPDPYRTIMFHLNPVSIITQEFRNAMIYNKFPNGYYMAYWLIIGLITGAVFVWVMYKYENIYVKVL